MPDELTEQKMPGFHPKDSLQPIDPRDAADLFIGGPPDQMLWRTAAYYLGLTESGERVFVGVTVVLPPSLVWDVSDEQIHELVVSGFEAVWEEVPREAVARIALKDVVIHRCRRLASGDVLSVLKEAGSKRLLLVAEASKYRDDVVDPERVIGRTGTLLAEDVWVPHIVRLATESLALTKDRGCALVFHSVDQVVKAESRKALDNVDGLYPIYVTQSDQATSTELVARDLPRWLAMAASGRSTEVLAEIAGAGLSPSDERQARLNIAVRLRDREGVTRLVREYLADGDELEAEFAARLGRMAHQFGDDDSARELFAMSVPHVADQGALVMALDALTVMGEQELLQQCWDRLQELFPGTGALAKNREYRLLLLCDSSIRGEAPSRAGFEQFETYLADRLYQQSEVDHNALLEHVSETWPDNERLAALGVALHALGHRNFQIAMMAALFAADDERYSEDACWLLLDVLRRMFLDEVQPAEGMEVYKLPLMAICQHLAHHPDAGRMRAELIEILDVELAGTSGLVVAASFAFDVIAAGAPMPRRTAPTASSNEVVLERFLETALQWMSDQVAIELGVTMLPRELVIDEPQRLISALELLMHAGTRMDGVAEDVDALERFAFLIGLLAPLVLGSTADLSALRQVAVKCWLHNRAQHARDLAEQLLSVAGDDPTRRRIAWGSYADILHHTGSTADALVGLACAAMTNAPMTAANLYQEAYVLLRLARDLGMADMARSVLKTCRRLYAIEGVGEQGRQRLDGIELSLDVARASALGPEALLALLERTRVHCAEVLERGDEIFSAAAHFLQMAGAVERAGQELPPAVIELRRRLQAQNVGGLLHVVSAAFPTPQEVVDLHNQLEAARYAADTAVDQRAMVVAAHRLLLRRVPEVSPLQAAVAVELLSDRSLEGSSENRLEAAWPAEFIATLSREGAAVLLLGLDSEGELAGVVARDGEVEVVRPPLHAVSFGRRVIGWSANYPYNYGLIDRDAGNGEIYSSMEALNLPIPSVERLLVVAQPALQQIPFNVSLIDGEFAGVTTAIGSAPSLSWLRSVRARPRSDVSRRVAWISCAPDSEVYGTLEIIYQRLSPVFDQHGFETDTSGSIPSNVRGANMAVVTAHGQLSSERRFIHRIADEQDLTESPVTLARALAGVELVILFVCSGGRVDRHPFTNTTVSLPKMLLDRGCRAVIASPWPLDGSVPGNWLATFLEAWEAGESVLDANFKANRRVSERLGPEANLCLAMAVYGDGLLTKVNAVNA